MSQKKALLQGLFLASIPGNGIVCSGKELSVLGKNCLFLPGIDKYSPERTFSFPGNIGFLAVRLTQRQGRERMPLSSQHRHKP